MRSAMTDAGMTAAGVLATELAPLGVEVHGIAPATACRDWARSGAMALTGSANGPVRLAPGGPASWARAAAALAGVDEFLEDSAALLGERAACAGFTRNGPRSVGGAFRAVRCMDGWLGLSLPRETDCDLVPALIGAPVNEDPWDAVSHWARQCSIAAAEERALLLSLPACAVATEPVPASRPAVDITLGARRTLSRRCPIVVDLSALWAGPLCAHLLGLAGARVIKVESRSRPDGARRGPHDFYDLLHGGHESVVVDFHNSQGRRALAQLVASADVVIEASRPRALQRLGIDAADHVAAGAIWVSITGYGRGNPDRVGFGDDVAAAAGLVVDDGVGPYPVGDAIADPLAGLTAAAAAATALRAGRGCLIDVSMRDVAARAGALPTDDAAVIRRQDTWWVDSCGEQVPVEPPRTRAVRSRGADFGAHTAQVLAEVRHI